MLYVLNTLLPVIVLVAGGWLLRRTGFADAAFFRSLNRLVYWIGLPALLFNKTASAAVDFGPAADLLAVLTAGTCVSILMAFAVAWFLHLPARSRGAFVQGAYRGNLAYVGLPVVLFALGGSISGETAATAEAVAVLTIVPVVVLYNVIAVFVLSVQVVDENRSLFLRLLRLGGMVLVNPLIVACLAGILWSLSGWPLPTALIRGTGLLGQIALPGSLLAVGAALTAKTLHGNYQAALAAVILKLFLAPAAGYGFARLAGFEFTATRTALLLLACPTAVASFVMAEQMGSDGELAASIVVLSTVLSVLPLALILLL